MWEVRSKQRHGLLWEMPAPRRCKWQMSLTASTGSRTLWTVFYGLSPNLTSTRTRICCRLRKTVRAAGHSYTPIVLHFILSLSHRGLTREAQTFGIIRGHFTRGRMSGSSLTTSRSKTGRHSCSVPRLACAWNETSCLHAGSWWGSWVLLLEVRTSAICKRPAQGMRSRGHHKNSSLQKACVRGVPPWSNTGRRRAGLRNPGLFVDTHVLRSSFEPQWSELRIGGVHFCVFVCV